jgi:hypothetical protein
MPLLILTDVEAARLAKPVRGKGGLQALLRRLQGNLQGTSVQVRIEDVARIRRYYSYDDGGFEGRLPVAALQRHGLLHD